jgi:hypothetical protein
MECSLSTHNLSQQEVVQVRGHMELEIATTKVKMEVLRWPLDLV